VGVWVGLLLGVSEGDWDVGASLDGVSEGVSLADWVGLDE
jgi:hypothetical protein